MIVFVRLTVAASIGEAGLHALFLFGRTGGQGYEGKAGFPKKQKFPKDLLFVIVD